MLLRIWQPLDYKVRPNGRLPRGVGKSAAWVNRLLKWRETGYQDGTPFGPQAKASRQRAQDVQATKHGQQKPETTSEQAQADAEPARAEAAKAEAAGAEAEVEKAKADATRAEAEARRRAEAKVKEQMNGFFHRPFRRDISEKGIPGRSRELLIKALGMLSSVHEGERANAGSIVEKRRLELGMTWDELIIPANEVKAPSPTKTKSRLWA